jgi:hypothetical protein
MSWAVSLNNAGVMVRCCCIEACSIARLLPDSGSLNSQAAWDGTEAHTGKEEYYIAESAFDSRRAIEAVMYSSSIVNYRLTCMLAVSVLDLEGYWSSSTQHTHHRASADYSDRHVRDSRLVFLSPKSRFGFRRYELKSV